ncbi:flagellar hook assembly protein FlgD [Sphingomonas sp. UYP23]
MASTFDSTLSSLGINATASNTANTAVKNSSTSLGTSDFLKLLTAQLQNQDPFSPTDNSQMVAQLAQVTSTSGIADMSTTLKEIQTKLNGTSTSDALSYVGKNILTASDTAYGRSTGGIAGAAEIAGDASDVSVSIKDSNGQLLKTIDLGAQKAGDITYDWDGKTASGADAGTGPFTVSVKATGTSGSVSSQNLAWAAVTAVSVPATGSPSLSVYGVGQVAISDVRQVS